MPSSPDTFLWSGVSSGVKQSGDLDLGVAYSTYPSTAAAVFTNNTLPAAPVRDAREKLDARDTVRGLVVNSGVANAATGPAGLFACRRVITRTSELLDVEEGSVLAASTGVIGEVLPDDAIRDALPEAVDRLSEDPQAFARAIMTTDTRPKLVSRSVDPLDATLIGVAKGSGMIRPDMATMLGFVFLDHPVEPDWWQTCLSRACSETFNRITVDGQMSTNDTVLALASRRPGRDPINADHAAAEALDRALHGVCDDLARAIVEDGEGATRTFEVSVTGAPDEATAETVARSVADSPLVKIAFYGGDPNWGRIYAAVGATRLEMDPERLSIAIDGFTVYDPAEGNGGVPPALQERMESASEHRVEIRLGEGRGSYTCRTCDLSEDYVTINAEYHT